MNKLLTRNEFQEPLLTREQFKEEVFRRDRYTCVFCSNPAVDAHHILDRGLWGGSGGYFISNGASVCEKCHLDCEQSIRTVEDCRKACNITNIIVPPHLHTDQEYDKWGNPTTKWIKYPRTPHLPWSPGVDDDIVTGSEHFQDKHIIVTEKMDGENTTMYRDHIHARSVDSRHHPSRDWIKQFWSERRHEIPDGWRVCGENVFAKHSIYYENLPSYFLGFSIWNDRNECLSWSETCEWFDLLNIVPVHMLYAGPYIDHLIKTLHQDLDFDHQEGYVIRTWDGFPCGEFTNNIAKYVRKNHVQTDEHWMSKPVEPNKIIKQNATFKYGSR